MFEINKICILLLQIAGKQAGMYAISELYQSFVCKKDKRVGEEIARLEVLKSTF